MSAPLSSSPSRRRFLKWGTAGALLLGGGTFVYRAVGRFGPAAPGYKVFDADELAVLDAACEAHFPGPPDWPLSAKEAGCTEFVDRYLGNLYPDNQLLFRSLLRALNVSTLVTHRRTFRTLSVEDRADVLQAWAESSLRIRRAGYQSLTLFIKTGYFENERVREAFSYSLGCNVPQEGRPQGI
jgi:hypothetical protein